MKEPFNRFFCRNLMLGLLPFASLASGENMKLVHEKTGYVVVEFQDGKALFNDRFLKAEMEEEGILIPPSQVEEFGGKQVIFPDDPLFQKAFTEVYYPLCIADPTYHWEN